MRLLALLSGVLSLTEAGAVQAYMQQAFYPVLAGVLIVASMGVPIPEDIPLLAAGVLLRTHPGMATWEGTLAVALVAIMVGDLVLYYLGRRWGPGVVNHRSVSWIITPALFRKATQKFHRYGMWYCFFGRFLLGVRSVMCMTAGATHFPYWRFFLADFAGALLSVPFFVLLGYLFAGMLPTLQRYLAGVETTVTVAVVIVIAAVVAFKIRRSRRRRAAIHAARASRAQALPRALRSPAQAAEGAASN